MLASSIQGVYRSTGLNVCQWEDELDSQRVAGRDCTSHSTSDVMVVFVICVLLFVSFICFFFFLIPSWGLRPGALGDCDGDQRGGYCCCWWLCLLLHRLIKVRCLT